ncbi:MAG: 50S ribosome-binding GTPase [Phycisphaerae bacterium]|nr:50S ribosome-binding GTPase [Phycisphaerae bacterium]
MGSLRWGISSSTSRVGEGGGSLVVLTLAGDLQAAWGALAVEPVGIGRLGLRDLGGIDRVLVARWADRHATLTPHAGAAVLREIGHYMQARGVLGPVSLDPALEYPEARDVLEARSLAAIARAASPRAVGLLLDQPARWSRDPCPEPRELARRSRVLDRLIEPPLVVVRGASNIGKSTLLNRLAGRNVAAAADEPGTTRDYVGANLELDGLLVRYADTPGLAEFGADPVLDEALCVSESIVALADLILLCGDSVSGFPAPPARAAALLRVGLRADLGPAPIGADCEVSSRTGAGLEDLARAVRRALVPDAVLEHPGPWRFWPQ